MDRPDMSDASFEVVRETRPVAVFFDRVSPGFVDTTRQGSIAEEAAQFPSLPLLHGNQRPVSEGTLVSNEDVPVGVHGTDPRSDAVPALRDVEVDTGTATATGIHVARMAIDSAGATGPALAADRQSTDRHPEPDGLVASGRLTEYAGSTTTDGRSVGVAQDEIAGRIGDGDQAADGAAERDTRALSDDAEATPIADNREPGAGVIAVREELDDAAELNRPRSTPLPERPVDRVHEAFASGAAAQRYLDRSLDRLRDYTKDRAHGDRTRWDSADPVQQQLIHDTRTATALGASHFVRMTSTMLRVYDAAPAQLSLARAVVGPYAARDMSQAPPEYGFELWRDLPDARFSMAVNVRQLDQVTAPTGEALQARLPLPTNWPLQSDTNVGVEVVVAHQKLVSPGAQAGAGADTLVGRLDFQTSQGTMEFHGLTFNLQDSSGQSDPRHTQWVRTQLQADFLPDGFADETPDDPLREVVLAGWTMRAALLAANKLDEQASVRLIEPQAPPAPGKGELLADQTRHALEIAQHGLGRAVGLIARNARYRPDGSRRW